MFFKPNEDTILDHIEMALRGGYRKAREYIPTREFAGNPRRVDEIIAKHAQDLLGQLYPDTVFAKSVDEAFARKKAWLMDPFDGHMNEYKQTWFGASTIALVHEGTVVAAGIHDLSAGTIFTASEDAGRYVTDDSGVRSWLRVTAAHGIAQTDKPRCLEIMDVICGPRDVLCASCDDPLDLIAAAFIARSAGCVVTDGDHMRWSPTSTDIIVASDLIAYRHATGRMLQTAP